MFLVFFEISFNVLELLSTWIEHVTNTWIEHVTNTWIEHVTKSMKH